MVQKGLYWGPPILGNYQVKYRPQNIMILSIGAPPDLVPGKAQFLPKFVESAQMWEFLVRRHLRAAHHKQELVWQTAAIARVAVSCYSMS